MSGLTVDIAAIAAQQAFSYRPYRDDDASRYLCRGSGCTSWAVGFTLYTDGVLTVQRYQCEEHIPAKGGGS